MGSPPAGHFLAGRQGPLFVLRHGPSSGTQCVLVVPPFAEEMNKCRRMVALLATRLADGGVATVVPDFYGTGDSGGDFVDADWNLWRDDLRRTARWCAETMTPVTGILAIRLGCSFACDDELLAALPALSRTIFWQPVLDGPRYLTQFLRLRVAASMANGVQESVADLRRELSTAGEIEIAGYRISASLAAALDATKVPSRLPTRLGMLEWLEIVRENGLPVSPSSARLIQAALDAGLDVTSGAVAGEPFWAATEIVTNDELIRRTILAFMRGDASHAHTAT